VESWPGKLGVGRGPGIAGSWGPVGPGTGKMDGSCTLRVGVKTSVPYPGWPGKFGVGRGPGIAGSWGPVGPGTGKMDGSCTLRVGVKTSVPYPGWPGRFGVGGGPGIDGSWGPVGPGTGKMDGSCTLMAGKLDGGGAKELMSRPWFRRSGVTTCCNKFLTSSSLSPAPRRREGVCWKEGM
jgi:hypothetical protein